MDPKELNTEQDFTTILDNFISNVNIIDEQETQSDISIWDVTLMDGLENEPCMFEDEWDNCCGDIILFV